MLKFLAPQGCSVSWIASNVLASSGVAGHLRGLKTMATIDAVARLRDAQTALAAAKFAAEAASASLTSARRSRAEELVGFVAVAEAHCNRLAYIVDGDLRAELADA
jgi:hypothetical protein